MFVVFLFVSSLICIFNLSLTRFEIIYSFILKIFVDLFAMIVYLISLCFGVHLSFNSNFF